MLTPGVTWTVKSAYGGSDAPGHLSTTAVVTNRFCKITISYGGRSASKTVTIINVP
jgi:hypothetical protein